MRSLKTFNRQDLTKELEHQYQKGFQRLGFFE